MSIMPPEPDGKPDSSARGILDDLLADRTEDPQGVTYLDLCRHVIDPNLSVEDCDYILWERTPFPLVMRPSDLRPYLEKVRDEIAARAGGDA